MGKAKGVSSVNGSNNSIILRTKIFQGVQVQFSGGVSLISMGLGGILEALKIFLKRLLNNPVWMYRIWNSPLFSNEWRGVAYS